MTDKKKSGSPWIGGVVLALLHFAFAMLFAMRTPFLAPGKVYTQGGGDDGIYTVDIGAPDELQHVILVSRLAGGGSYPVMDPKDPKLNFTYESLQPPLFYMVGAGWSKLLGLSALPKFADYVEKHTYTEAEEVLKKGTFEEIGSSRAEVDSEGLKLRALDALIGTLTVIGVFALIFWSSRNRWAAGAGAAVAAFLPMHVALSGAVSNDPLLICLCTWVLALLALVARDELCIKRGLLIGFLTGLAFLTKTTALALVPVLLLAPLMNRDTIKFSRLVPGAILALLMGGYWWAHNQSVYGDPFALKIFNEAFKDRNPTADAMIARVGSGAYWQAVFTIMAHSLVGVFSYMDIYLEGWVYKLGWALLAGASLLGVIQIAKGPNSEDEGPSRRSTHLLGIVFIAVMLALFVQFNRGFFQAQARYILPAIGPISALCGLGIAFLYDRAKTFVIPLIWFAGLLAVLAQAAQTLTPGFAVRTLKGIPTPENASNK